MIKWIWCVVFNVAGIAAIIKLHDWVGGLILIGIGWAPILFRAKLG